MYRALREESLRWIHPYFNGETIDPTTLKHNNMQPFFGGKIRGAGPNINTSESILDNKTGSGSQSVAKQEQELQYGKNKYFGPDVSTKTKQALELARSWGIEYITFSDLASSIPGFLE